MIMFVIWNLEVISEYIYRCGTTAQMLWGQEKSYTLFYMVMASVCGTDQVYGV
jgi:hypothetical protein